MNSPRATVIVPVFNGEERLRECLESIAAQTAAPLEVMVIDDGSTDDTPRLASEFCEENEGFVYHRTVNRGAGPARNLGISRARGSFILFVDADDVVDPTHVESLIRPLEIDDGVGLAVGNVRLRASQGTAGAEIAPIKRQEVVATADYLRRFVVDAGLTIFPASVWNKAYRLDRISGVGVEFPSVRRVGEDFIFNMQYLHHVDDIALVPRATYAYDAETPGSLTKRVRTPLAYWQDAVPQLESLKSVADHCRIESSVPLERIAVDCAGGALLCARGAKARDLVGLLREAQLVGKDFGRVRNASASRDLPMRYRVLATIYSLRLAGACFLGIWALYRVVLSVRRLRRRSF